MLPELSVLSVRTGVTRETDLGAKSVRTASLKLDRQGNVAVTATGLLGDEQGDRRIHGGVDKALCVYPSEHYPVWKQDHGRDFPLGAFGENLVTKGLSEDDLRIGDHLRVGTALTQVVAPRRPCWKLGARWSDSDLPLAVQETGLTGFYLRVKEVGHVQRGDSIEITDRDERAVTVRELNRVMNVDRDDLAAARHVLRTASLPASWRRTLERRLSVDRHEEENRVARLYGGAS